MLRLASITLAAAAALLASAPADATLKGAVAAASRVVEGPYGVRLRAPALRTPCTAAGTMRVPVSARWSQRALRRPVRSIRVLLQRPGSESVIDAVVLVPARVTTTRRAVLRLSACRANLDVRYELFVGRRVVRHDHQSVVFRTHGS
ncbi:MAG TPA: hypothetical protein VGF63_08470 [Solirubrobacteraceae bacterium]|jgi:hypothetical protein